MNTAAATIAQDDLCGGLGSAAALQDGVLGCSGWGTVVVVGAGVAHRFVEQSAVTRSAGPAAGARAAGAGGAGLVMSTRRRCGATLERSAVALAVVAQTGRIGRPADKREFLPRFRPTIAGTATGAVMKIEEIPVWVPETVHRMAVVYWQSCHPLMRKALIAPAMERVWSYFELRSVEHDFLSRIEFIPDLRSVDLAWPWSAVSEQAMACLFFAMLIACTRTSQIVYSDTIDAELEKLDETIKRVEALRNFAPDPVTPLPANVERAIVEIVEHCNSKKSLLDYSEKPAVLKKPGKNDIARAFVRELGTATFGIYGQCCYGQLAAIANVLFTIDPPATERSTEKWCVNPPLPSMAISKRETPFVNKS